MENISTKTKLRVGFTIYGAVMILFVLLTSGCAPEADKQGDYWVIDWADKANPVMFKGNKVGSIGCGLTAYRTLEGNWVLAARAG